MNRTVIIGSGISGLTAALLLNRYGHEVTIVEQQAQAGGALHRFKRNGVSFDVGFHYTGGLGKGEMLQTLWKYCGIEEDISTIAFPDDAADCLRVGDLPATVHSYFSYERFAEELFKHFPREKEGIKEYFRVIKEAGESNPFYNHSQPLTEFLRALAFPEQKALGDLIRSCTVDPYLQAALCHPVFLHGVNPDDIGIIMHASVAHPVYTGMYTVDRGGQGIADAYLAKLAELDIRVLTNTPVEKILVEKEKVKGVATPRGDIPADNVIFTGHPSLLPDLVQAKALRKVYCDRLKEMTDTCSMFIVFGSVQEDTYDEQLVWNNYYSLPKGLSFPNTNSSARGDIFFLSGCGLRDSEQNSSGRAVILMRPAGWEETESFDRGRKKRAPEYTNWKQEQSAKLVESVKGKWNGLMDGVQVINTASPLTFRDELNYVQGGAYGVQHSTDQFAVGARTRLPGLWLSGQSTLLTGILGASLSALITVGGIVGLEPLWKEVRDCT